MTLEDLYRLLRSSHVQTQGIVDTLPQAILVLDEAFCVINANHAFFDAFQTNREDTLGRSFFELGNGQWDVADLRHLVSEVIPRTVAIVGYEITHDFPKMGKRTICVSARRLVHPDHNSKQMLLVFEDITNQQRADAVKDILLAETHHRMQNLLAVVRALATQTEAKGLTGEQYRDAFMGRFEALLNVQNLSFSCDGDTSLAKLAAEALKPYSKQAVIAGPTVNVPTSQIISLSLVLHELATNAVKYGAFSAPEGSVHLTWDVKAHGGAKQVAIDWVEVNGPPVVPPTRKGFGTRLIEFSSSSGMGGEVNLDFAPSGLHARVNLPVP